MGQIRYSVMNQDESFKINVLEDISYQIIENGQVVRTASLDHKLRSVSSVIAHIRNDIANGYYPKLGKSPVGGFIPNGE